MKNVVIIEGPTAVGKTTLIGRILAECPTLQAGVHRPQPDKAMAFDEGALIRWYHDAIEANRVVDRWIYSNGVYSAVFGNQKRVPHTFLEARARELFRTVVLFLTADPGVLYSRIQSRDKPCVPKNAGTMPNLLKSVERFDQELKLCGLPKVGIRCNDEDLDSGRALAKALKAIRS